MEMLTIVKEVKGKATGYEVIDLGKLDIRIQKIIERNPPAIASQLIIDCIKNNSL